MKQFAFRTVFAATLATLLAACGSGDIDAGYPTQTLALSGSATVSSGVMSDAAAVVGAPVAIDAVGPASNAPVAAADAPAPDCAAEGCSSLRIIDGNAEAYRYDAQRRAAAEQQT